MFFMKPKIKPAFKNSAEIEGAAEDFAKAAEYGPLRVSEKALYLSDFDTRYIPLNELASVELDVQEQPAGTCCNMTSAAPHDLCVTALSGGSVTAKVLNAQKARQALQKILELNPSVRCSGF